MINYQKKILHTVIFTRRKAEKIVKRRITKKIMKKMEWIEKIQRLINLNFRWTLFITLIITEIKNYIVIICILLKIRQKIKNNTLKKLIIFTLQFIRPHIIISPIIKESIITLPFSIHSINNFPRKIVNWVQNEYSNNIYLWHFKKKLKISLK